MTDPGSFTDTWERFVEYNTSKLNTDDVAIEKELVFKVDSQDMRNIFTALKNNPPPLGLIHYDLSLDNVIITEDNRVYLIDWGSAQVGPVPHLDIAEILHSSLKEDSGDFESFLEGYGKSFSDYNALKSQIQKVDLLMYTDKLRWALDKRQDLITSFAKTVRSRLNNVKSDI